MFNLEGRQTGAREISITWENPPEALDSSLVGGIRVCYGMVGIDCQFSVDLAPTETSYVIMLPEPINPYFIAVSLTTPTGSRGAADTIQVPICEWTDVISHQYCILLNDSQYRHSGGQLVANRRRLFERDSRDVDSTCGPLRIHTAVLLRVFEISWCIWMPNELQSGQYDTRNCCRRIISGGTIRNNCSPGHSGGFLY